MKSKMIECWCCKGTRISQHGGISTGCVICNATGELPEGVKSYSYLEFRKMAKREGADLDKIAEKLREGNDNKH